MSKTLAQWLALIEQSHSKEIDMGLSRTKLVLDNLDFDLRHTKVITVAGTNGKGTTSATIESILNSCGVKTGRYGSPHMFRFNERIVVNQQEVCDADICNAFEKVRAAQQSIPLTYFEYATLAALVCFCEAKVDVIILEVGLGGRLDATNVIDADVAVLTSIGLDHQDWLGDSLQGIANEKAGIIKETSKVVIGFRPDDINVSFSEHSFISGQQDVLQYGIDYCVHEAASNNDDAGNRSGEIKTATLLSQNPDNGSSTCTYSWQNSQVPAQNAINAIAAIWQLKRVVSKNDATIKSKLLKALTTGSLITKAINTVRLPGRLQTLLNKPLVIADVAHNQQAADYLCSQLLRYGDIQQKSTKTDVQFHFVVGMLKDKNIEETLGAMSAIRANWYTCSIGTYRGESAQSLETYLSRNILDSDDKPNANNKELGKTYGLISYDSVREGVAAALESAKSTDIICVFGSFITVAEATPIFLNTEVAEHV